MSIESSESVDRKCDKWTEEQFDSIVNEIRRHLRTDIIDYDVLYDIPGTKLLVHNTEEKARRYAKSEKVIQERERAEREEREEARRRGVR